MTVTAVNRYKTPESHELYPNGKIMEINFAFEGLVEEFFPVKTIVFIPNVDCDPNDLEVIFKVETENLRISSCDFDGKNIVRFSEKNNAWDIRLRGRDDNYSEIRLIFQNGILYVGCPDGLESKNYFLDRRRTDQLYYRYIFDVLCSGPKDSKSIMLLSKLVHLKKLIAITSSFLAYEDDPLKGDVLNDAIAEFLSEMNNHSVHYIVRDRLI